MPNTALEPARPFARELQDVPDQHLAPALQMQSVHHSGDRRNEGAEITHRFRSISTSRPFASRNTNMS